MKLKTIGCGIVALSTGAAAVIHMRELMLGEPLINLVYVGLYIGLCVTFIDLMRK